jgi:hypothetical protein
MDITDALAPTSDQLDAVELVNPRTFTIAEGSRLGTRDGKTVVEIRLVGFPRVWRPSKGMLDVLAKCWGTDGKAWPGRRVTLYNDPEVTFGKEKPGGVRISHLSHIEKARDVTIRGRGAGKVQLWHVEPLTDPPAEPTEADVRASTDRDLLRSWWKYPHLQAAIKARVDELDGGEQA